MAYKSEIGKRGEQLAIDHLKSNGYTVLAQNLHVSRDEIDILAEDEHCLVFVEVKTRAQTASNKRYGRPASAVDRQKQQHLIRAAESYLHTNPLPHGKRVRIDIIEIYFPAIHQNTPININSLIPLKIVHMKNAILKH